MRSLQGSLSLLAQSSESSLVGDSDLGEHLTVEVDACLLQTVHEGGVVHTVSLAAGGDTGDPQTTEVALLHATAGECVVAALHDGFLSHLKVLGLAAPVTLSSLQDLISSLARHHCALNSCHFSFLL